MDSNLALQLVGVVRCVAHEHEDMVNIDQPTDDEIGQLSHPLPLLLGVADLSLALSEVPLERLGPGQVGTVVAFVLLRSKILVDEGRKGTRAKMRQSKKMGVMIETPKPINHDEFIHESGILHVLLRYPASPTTLYSNPASSLRVVRVYYWCFKGILLFSFYVLM